MSEEERCGGHGARFLGSPHPGCPDCHPTPEAERRWTIYLCPGCGVFYNGPGGCGPCEPSPRKGHPRPVLERVEVVPASALAHERQRREEAERKRDAAIRFLNDERASASGRWAEQRTRAEQAEARVEALEGAIREQMSR